MKKEEIIALLGRLGYHFFDAEKEKLDKTEIYSVLRELSDSSDYRLIEAFPVVLANCAHRGIELNAVVLLSTYSEKSVERKSLEKLLLASADLLSQEGLKVPDGMSEFTEALRLEYGNLLSREEIKIGRGISLSLARLRNTIRRYAADLELLESTRVKEGLRQLRSFRLNLHLSILFPPKQKEIVLKKLKGDSLNKTEQEYYSRVVRKKLEALANMEIRKIALTLTKK